MNFNVKSFIVFSLYFLTFLSLTSCGDSVETPSTVEGSVDSLLLIPLEQKTPTVSASSLQKMDFNYAASRILNVSEGATAVIDLPDQSQTIIGNIMLALDVIDLVGIEQISLDFSNGNPDIPVLQVCGGTSSSCDNQNDNTKYRLFITGINPHNYGWQSGQNTIKVWVDNSQGERSVAATFELNWQAAAISQIQAEFTNVVVNQVTGESTGDLLVSWSEISNYLFYNAFISTEPDVNSQSFATLDEGQARLSLIDNSVVFEGLDANKEYYFTVSGVDDGGESAFSTQKSVIDLSRGAPVVTDDVASLDENTSITVSVIDNDSSSNNQLTIVNFTQGKNGSVTNNGDGTLIYQHDGSEVSEDQFTYKVNNGEFDSATATVNIIISLVNDVPVGVEDVAIVNEGGTVLINVRNNDSDEETLNNSLTIINASNGFNGVVVNNDNGTVTYTHNGGESLSDNFTYFVSDGVNSSAPVTVSITITPVNDAPVISSSSVLTLPENTADSTEVYLASATDSENDEFSWSLDDSENIFSINPISGVITVNDKSALDFETLSPYNLQLTVTDNGTPMQSDTISIAFTVTDVIENQELILEPLFGTNGEKSFNTYSYSSDDTIVNTVRQSDGKLVMVVNTSLAGVENIAAIRLNTNGSVDNSYGDNGRKTFLFTNSQRAQKAIIDSADNLYIVGTETNSNFYPFAMKIDQSGNLDTSFSSDGKFEYSFPNDTEGSDIHLHSNGYIYVASSGFSESIGYNTLKLLRIDITGNIVSLNSDNGTVEFDLFNLHDFFPVGLNEISTGELVVFGTDFDSQLGEGNFAAAVLNATDFTQPSVKTNTFDITQIIDGSGSSNDTMISCLSLNADSYVLAGASTHLQGTSGPEEATMLKVDVSNSAITMDASFASSGAFTADLDGDSTFMSFIETLVVDEADNIVFVSSSFNGEDYIYITNQISNTGLIKESFNSQIIMANFATQPTSNLIIDPVNNNLYLASVNGLLGNDDVAFQQFLNDGSEVHPTYNLVNFTSSSESLTDINLLSSPPNSSALWVNSYKPIDEFSFSDSITLLTSDGQIDHTINKGIAPLQPPYISYGPSLELSDGSIVYTTFDSELSSATIYKITDNNFTADIDFVPNVGNVQVSLTLGSELSDITYDALNNQIVISGTEISSGNRAFIVKVNATNGTVYNGGNFSNGVVYVDIGANNVSTFERVIAQNDGTLIGLGNTEQGGFDQPFLVKLTSDGALDTSFNLTGYKIFDLGMPSEDLKAIDLLQSSDNSLLFNVNNVTSSTAHIVKVSAAGIFDSAFATSGVLNVAIGATSTVINDISLDANEDIYAVGYATNTDNDNLVLKIRSVDGILDPLFNAYTTSGYWMFDEGGNEQINKVLFDPLTDHILLGDTSLGPLGDADIRIRTFNLIQNDNR